MGQVYYVGVDIGGTAIKYGIVTPEGEIVHQWDEPTDLSDKGAHIADQVIRGIKMGAEDRGIKREEILAVGVGCPGPVDEKTGDVVVAVNLGWHDYPLRHLLYQGLKCPVSVLNDANAAAMGEIWMGAGQGHNNTVFITLGTGIGAGIISDGRIINGSHFSAGEIGHISVPNPYQFPCGCGKNGCVETVASADGLVKVAKAHYKENPPQNSKELFERAASGDATANAVIEEVCDMLAYMLGAVCLTVDPEILIVGGGMSAAGDALLEPLNRHLQPYLFPAIRNKIGIRQATLGNDAGLLGAVYYNISTAKS